MVRIISSFIVLFFALTGCTPSTEKSSTVATSPTAPTGIYGFLRRVQASVKPEITAEKIMSDIVGRVVRVSELTGTWSPTEWTFEADEFRQAEILQKQVTETQYTIVIFMTTRNNHKPGEDDVQVSGRLQLYYEWRGGQWVLTGIDNLSFRYSLGQST